MNSRTRITRLTGVCTATAMLLTLAACSQNEERTQAESVTTVDIAEPSLGAPMAHEVIADMEYARASSPTMLPQYESRERYDGEEVSPVRHVAEAPVSTFSVDVDTGSYANVRRFLSQGQLPPQAAVRTEELINYFRYDYPAPTTRAQPFSVTTDMAVTPWNSDTRILRIGLRGYDLPRENRPAANLVFLLDVLAA